MLEVLHAACQLLPYPSTLEYTAFAVKLQAFSQIYRVGGARLRLAAPAYAAQVRGPCLRATASCMDRRCSFFGFGDIADVVNPAGRMIARVACRRVPA